MIGIIDAGEDALMLQFKSGDVLSENVEALVNTVNCVGVMGRGIALQFKRAFPDNFKAYADACKRGKVLPGQLFIFKTGMLTNPRYIINFPTKRHWRGKSRIEDIEAGLRALVDVIREHSIRSIALPPLGSGLGGLEWHDVRLRIEDALCGINHVRIIVFEPNSAPEVAAIAPNRDVPAMTPGRAALVRLMHRYIGGLLDPSITLLEVHKLMYFMQVAGEPLKLRFSEHKYGPYADNLRHVLNAIEGYYVSGYADGGDAPDKELKLIPGAVNDAQSYLVNHNVTKERLERVATLIDGFESAFGLELLATVHWVLQKQAAESQDEVVAHTHAWNKRKQRFTPRQIKLAVRVLTEKGWTRGLAPICH